MDPFLVLLHSVSVSLSSSELTELKFLCQSRVGKRKLELVQSGVDLFNVLLEQTEMSRENTVLLRKLLVSLRRQDLLRRLDDFEAGAEGGAAPEERVISNAGADLTELEELAHRLAAYQGFAFEDATLQEPSKKHFVLPLLPAPVQKQPFVVCHADLSSDLSADEDIVARD
nr:FAS-associated death domain protein isoform X2 [Globicephala melas]